MHIKNHDSFLVYQTKCFLFMSYQKLTRKADGIYVRFLNSRGEF